MDDPAFRQKLADILEKLSETPPKSDTSTADAVARIDKVTSAARSNWFWFFGVLGYAALTLMGIQDADFFSASKSTTLPVLNFSVNLLNFMVFAPVLITVLYAYLHGVIELLWRDLSRVPALVGGDYQKNGNTEQGAVEARVARNGETEEEGEPIVTLMPVWLLIEAALIIRKWRRPDEPAPVVITPLSWIGTVTVFMLIWGAAPFVVGWFWLRSTVLHDFWLTAGLATCLWFCIAVGMLSLRSLVFAMAPRRTGASA